MECYFLLQEQRWLLIKRTLKEADLYSSRTLQIVCTAAWPFPIFLQMCETVSGLDVKNHCTMYDHKSRQTSRVLKADMTDTHAQ